MAYKIESKPPLNIVTVTYKGKVNLDTRLKAANELCSKYSDFKPFRVLIDVRNLVMDMLFGEQEAFGEYLANHYDLHHARVAVLHKPGFNPNAVIDISANRNGFQMVEFSNLSKAQKWLLVQDSD